MTCFIKFILLCLVYTQSLDDLSKIAHYNQSKIIQLSEKFILESQINMDNPHIYLYPPPLQPFFGVLKGGGVYNFS